MLLPEGDQKEDQISMVRVARNTNTTLMMKPTELKKYALQSSEFNREKWKLSQILRKKV